MRITKLELGNFKRFTDLTIEGIPETSKLVLLIGSNGSGKSSVFDAFDTISKRLNIFDLNYSIEPEFSDYFAKEEGNIRLLITFSDGRQIGNDSSFKLLSTNERLYKKFIGRSSIRIVPRINSTGRIVDISSNSDGPLSFIDVDERFNSDVTSYIQMIDNALREPVFSGRSADTLKIFQDFIRPLNTSLLNIFCGDETTTIQIAEYQNANAQQNPRLIFKKGNSKINYDLLSHGEKQVVILLLNFIVRKEQYKDAIIYIDEMDCHLNTALQSNLMAEIVNTWIPDNAQLWTASHALGFIDFAKNADNASIIDLDLLNFDLPQVIAPEPKENLEVYDIAIPKETLQNILKGYKLVVVENQNDKHYNLALNEKGYFFLPAMNSREVFLTIKADQTKLGLRDRDYFMEDEINAIQKKFPHLRILHYYAFENYIYHPDNIAELNPVGFDKQLYKADITKQKNEKLNRILLSIATSRQTYVEFKDAIKNTEKLDPILEALESDDFETFYPYFSMKTYYSKTSLQVVLNDYTISDLVKTNWFKQKIEELLK
ncbi:AAA family ATPase [Chitinophaga sp.]|uniref:AAA family ATPase n=1 Tax=Chitinophaga sp. TaxID=1869181 RepID=UPI0031DB3DFF